MHFVSCEYQDHAKIKASCGLSRSMQVRTQDFDEGRSGPKVTGSTRLPCIMFAEQSPEFWVTNEIFVRISQQYTKDLSMHAWVSCLHELR